VTEEHWIEGLLSTLSCTCNPLYTLPSSPFCSHDISFPQLVSPKVETATHKPPAKTIYEARALIMLILKRQAQTKAGKPAADEDVVHCGCK
jgi:hypothetical protein